MKNIQTFYTNKAVMYVWLRKFQINKKKKKLKDSRPKLYRI